VIRRRRLRAAVIALGLSLVAAAAALARPKRMWFAEKDGQLVVSTSYTELFDERAYARLVSGFPATVALRAYVYEEGRELPVAFTAATFRVVYDLWDEIYLVRIADVRGSRNLRFQHRADALQAVTELHDLPVASLAQIPVGRRYFCAMIVELNPVSAELLAEMRRWLTRRAGGATLDDSSSFFGSFVSVFVNPKLEGADAALQLRSQPFFRVDR
jgi:hypothetical protein